MHDAIKEGGSTRILGQLSPLPLFTCDCHYVDAHSRKVNVISGSNRRRERIRLLIVVPIIKVLQFTPINFLGDANPRHLIRIIFHQYRCAHVSII